MRRYMLMILLALALTAPAIAAADPAGGFSCTGANGFVPLVCTSGSPQLDAAYQSPNLSTYLNRLFVIALSVGAMLAVLRLVYAGYIYMVSGVGNFASMGKAREVIGSVVFGLLLLLGIYLILFQINPNILKLDITQNIK